MAELRCRLKGEIGFVPTMGYLHEGHLSLLRHARKHCDIVIASIFINPTQFAPSEDFSSYPCDIARDSILCASEGVGILFIPEISEMYPDGFDTFIEVKGITERLEGASRPTHFKGVTTVVAKLFNIIRPDKAYFGQKDAQQALVVKKMIMDLDMGIEIVTLPTIREPDGLAMSSRNEYLNKKERKAASSLYHSLMLADQLCHSGESSTTVIKDKMAALLNSHSQSKIDYISIADPKTLMEMDELTPPALVSLAVKIGKTRLIDNILLK